MKIHVQNIRDSLLFLKFKNLERTRRLCSLVGFTNFITCAIFYYWLFTFKASGASSSFDYAKNLLITAVITHIYINTILIQWTLNLDNNKLKTWAWISLICVSPLGISLITIGSNEKIWQNLKNQPQTNNSESVFHSLANSFVNLSENLKKSLEYLYETYPEDFQNFLKMCDLSPEKAEEWPNKAKYLIIALGEIMKQTKKKSSFSDIDFGAHWYDQRYFDFAIKDPKCGIVPNLKYKYSVGFIVLDEFNNYKKILKGKQEIKNNMRFGPAKTICLHWGKGFKVYVNE